MFRMAGDQVVRTQYVDTPCEERNQLHLSKNLVGTETVDLPYSWNFFLQSSH